MSKLSIKEAFKPSLGRLLHPVHLWRAMRLSRKYRKDPDARHRSKGDTRLALYAELLPGGFLNYGYHEECDKPPEERSLHEMQRGQVSLLPARQTSLFRQVS